MYSKETQLYIYIYISILFHYRLLQDIESSSLCSAVGPCFLCLFFLCWWWNQGEETRRFSDCPWQAILCLFFFFCNSAHRRLWLLFCLALVIPLLWASTAPLSRGAQFSVLQRTLRSLSALSPTRPAEAQPLPSGPPLVGLSAAQSL